MDRKQNNFKNLTNEDCRKIRYDEYICSGTDELIDILMQIDFVTHPLVTEEAIQSWFDGLEIGYKIELINKLSLSV